MYTYIHIYTLYTPGMVSHLKTTFEMVFRTFSRLSCCWEKVRTKIHLYELYHHSW